MEKYYPGEVPFPHQGNIFPRFPLFFFKFSLIFKRKFSYRTIGRKNMLYCITDDTTSNNDGLGLK